MNGVIVVRSLLVADIGVTALIPAARIVAGIIPQGTSLPARHCGLADDAPGSAVPAERFGP